MIFNVLRVMSIFLKSPFLYIALQNSQFFLHFFFENTTKFYSVFQYLQSSPTLKYKCKLGVNTTIVVRIKKDALHFKNTT